MSWEGRSAEFPRNLESKTMASLNTVNAEAIPEIELNQLYELGYFQFQTKNVDEITCVPFDAELSFKKGQFVLKGTVSSFIGKAKFKIPMEHVAELLEVEYYVNEENDSEEAFDILEGYGWIANHAE